MGDEYKGQQQLVQKIHARMFPKEEALLLAQQAGMKADSGTLPLPVALIEEGSAQAALSDLTPQLEPCHTATSPSPVC